MPTISLRRWLVAGLLAVLGARAATASSECELSWRITPHTGGSTRMLDVELTFPAGKRSETIVRLQPDWAGITDFPQQLGGWSPGVEPMAEPYRWRVRHLPGALVTLRYQAASALADPDANAPLPHQMLYRTQLGAGWFQFFGHAVLLQPEPWGDDRAAALCLQVDGLDPTQPFVSSHGDGRGPSWRVALQAAPQVARHAFYAGGRAWRVHRRAVAGAELSFAVRGHWAVPDDTFVDAAAGLIGAQRRFWREAAPPRMLIALTPNHVRSGSNGGTLVFDSAVMMSADDFAPGSEAFESLIGHENLHQWIPRRFGALGNDPGAPLRYWFSEGFTDYYTHRLLLRSGLWTLERYADELTRKVRRYLQSPARNARNAEVAAGFFRDRELGSQPYARGELLALQWDRALRSRGHGGLDDVMRGLLQPAPDRMVADAPLATDRLLAALRQPLGDRPAHDVVRHIDEGTTIAMDADLLGPCFRQTTETVPVWALGFSTESFQRKRAIGVASDGPAHAAGLREGMVLTGFSVYHGQLDKPVELWVLDGDAARKLSYTPTDGRTVALPRWLAREGAADAADCRAWRER